MNAGRPDDQMPPDDVGRVCSPLRGRRRRWTPHRMALACFKLAAGLVVLAVVAAGILTVRLHEGPIVIDGLGDKIASALHERFGSDAHFVLGDTSLVQRGFGPTLTIDRLSVSGPDGQSVLSAPKAEVSIDPFALMFGKVVPKRLEVFDVTLRLALLKNGDLAVAAGDGLKPFFEMGRGGDKRADAPKPASAVTPDTADAGKPVATRRAVVMKQAAAAIRQFLDVLTNPHSAIAAVDRLGIARGTLVIQDEATNDETVYKGLDLSFDKAHGKTSFAVSAAGPSGRWTVSAIATGAPGANRRFHLKVDKLSIDELQLAAGSRSLGVETDMPIGMNLDLGLKPDNTLSEAAGDFTLGRGFIRLDDPDQEPAFIDEIHGAFHWNSVDRRVEIDRTRYVGGKTRFTLGGTIRPPLNEGEPWNVELATTEPGVLGPDRKGQKPVRIPHASFEGHLLPDQKMFVIDRFAVRADPGGIALAGEVDWVNGPHIRFGASIDPTPVATVQRAWPAFVAAPVRAWILAHFDGGTVTSGTLKVDYDQNALQRMRADRAPPDASVSLDFVLSRGTVSFLDGVPPLDHVEGRGHITGRTSHFYLTSGTIDVDGREIDVSNGLFFVPNANVHPTPANLSAHVAGSVDAVTDLLTRNALRPYASIPLDPSTLHGRVDGRLDKELTLGPEGASASAALSVNAKVTDFVADRLVGKERLENASLSIAVARGALKATGQGRIFGGPATFEIDRVGAGPPNATIAVTLDDAARAKLGLSAIPGLSGPMTAHVNASLGDPSRIRAQVELDLAKTTVAAAYLGLSKPAGRPAKIMFTVASGENRILIEPISCDIASLQARGSIELNADNAFQSAHFSSFKVSPGDDMKLDVAKSDDVFKLTIRGSTIDARPFLKALTSTPANESTSLSRNAKAEKTEVDKFRGFDIDLRSGILTGFNKEVMSGVDLKLSKRGAQIRQFNVQGRFGRSAVSGSMDSSQRIRVATRDAGALVSFVDLYKHMEGGQLAANMTMSEEALAGSLEIHDFILRDEPAIRRLVAQSATISAPGDDTEAARRINAGAVGFKRLKVNFERAGSRLELRDATMYGPDIGLSVDGWLDYSHNRVAMNGTFVPAFAINNLFSQIPVFGAFLGGKSNEGLLAITFRISGLASSPTLSINPLSAITPGFLRNIFSGLDTPGIQSPGDGEPSR